MNNEKRAITAALDHINPDLTVERFDSDGRVRFKANRMGQWIELEGEAVVPLEA